MVQYARPASTIAAGIWLGNVSGANLHLDIDEVTHSESDYIASSPNTNGTGQVGLSSVTDPAVSTGHVLRWYYSRNKDTKTLTIAAHLYSGATLIVTRTFVDPTLVFSSDVYTLSAGEADAITDYSDLRITFETTANGGAGQLGQVSWAELEVPSAAATSHELAAVASGAGSASAALSVPTYVFPDDTDWNLYGLVLADAPATWEDHLWAGSPGCVVIVGGVYYLYYVGAASYDEIGDTSEHRAIGVATSSDGVHWTKYGSNPIITYGTGGTPYPNNEYPEEGATNPTVLYDGTTWHMWYGASRYTGPDAVDVDIRYRTSTDGLTWTDDALVYSNAGDEYIPISVFKEGSTYYLYYLGPLTGGMGALRVMSGTNPATLSGTTEVLAGSYIGASGLVSINDDTFAMHLGTISGADLIVNVYTIHRATPTSISSLRDSYNLGNYRRFAIVYDSTVWRMYQMDTSGGANDGNVVLRTAYGSIQQAAALASGAGTATAAARVERRLAASASGAGSASAALTVATEGWEVQRSDGDNENFATITTEAAEATTYDDSDSLVNGTTYYYRVRLVTGGVAGSWSNEASVAYSMATTHELAAVANGAGVASVTLQLSRRAAALSAGAGTATVALTASKRVAAVAAGTSSSAAAASVTRTAQGVATGDSSASAAATVAKRLAATATGASSTTASIDTGAPLLAALSEGTSTATASARVVRTVKAESDGASSVAASATVEKRIAASAAGASSSAAALQTGQGLAARAEGASTFTASAQAHKHIAAESDGASASTAAARVDKHLAASAAGTSAATADLEVTAATDELAAVANGASTVTAAARVEKRVAATAAGASTASAAVTLRAGIAGTAAGTSSASAGLRVVKTFGATIAADSVAEAALKVEKRIAATANGEGSATAGLEVGIYRYWLGTDSTPVALTADTALRTTPAGVTGIVRQR